MEPNQSQSKSPTPKTGANDKPSSKSMRMVIVLVIVVLLAIVGIAIAEHNKNAVKVQPITSSTLQPGYVSITANGFSPQGIQVKVGQSVVWTNNDINPHQVASDPYPTDNGLAGFNSDSSITTNQTYSFVFDKVGTFNYHDNLNPTKFKGTVTVVK